MDTNTINRITNQVIAELTVKKGIGVGISARHVHLSRKHLDILFGEGYELNVQKMLMAGEFAAKETVTLVSDSLKSIEGVRVLGPVRANTQVEISRTDAFVLKNSPPVRASGDIEGSAAISLIGPKGAVFLNQGLIIANRHIHMEPKTASYYNLVDNSLVDVVVSGRDKKTKFFDVQIRVKADFINQMHIDTDDANACGIKNGDKVQLTSKD